MEGASPGQRVRTVRIVQAHSVRDWVTTTRSFNHARMYALAGGMGGAATLGCVVGHCQV
jgi:hypothetical protein